MPPKKAAGGGASKKADLKKAEKVIEDKTFGLKNKNKSKTVQKYVQSVTAHAKHAAGVRVKTEAERAAEAKAKKDAVSREEAELRMLFSQMATGAAKKSKAEEAAREAEAARLAELSAQGDGKPAWVEVDMTGKPIEEVIEYQRAKLAYEGKKGTPVNEETFAKWKADKAEKRRQENAALVAKEMAKKTKGKGLSVLSGKALFEYDASLFVDDEEALADKVDVSQLKSLMEHDEEEEVLAPPPDQDEDGTAATQDGDHAVAVQEDLYLEDADDDLDGLDDDDDEEEDGAAAHATAGGGKAAS